MLNVDIKQLDTVAANLGELAYVVKLPTIWFKEKYPDVFKKWGQAVDLKSTKDGVNYVHQLNEDFLADSLGSLGNPVSPTVFVGREERFYRYAPEIGIYIPISENQIVSTLSSTLQQCASECDVPNYSDTKSLRFQLSKTSQLHGVIRKAKGLLNAGEDHFDANVQDYIACANGMLRLSDMQLVEFSPDFKRRNKLSVPFDRDAKCPTFMDILMRQALDDEDIAFLQKWFGLALLGKNLSQIIVILSGTAQGGKTTFVNIVIGVIGKENISTLRTEQLGQRFETASFLGKTLLVGSDVPADFLTQRNATILKSLTGGDTMTVELKNGRERPEIVGAFNVIISSNSRLIIRLEGDREAWRRRLAVIEYKRPKVSNPINALADIILKTEGPGVLNWALQGLKEVRDNGWRIHLTQKQSDTVDRVLLESESARIFVQRCLEKDNNSTLTANELLEAYASFCKKQDWAVRQDAKESKFETLIFNNHTLSLRHDIQGKNGKPQRGWKGIKLKES